MNVIFDQLSPFVRHTMGWECCRAGSIFSLKITHAKNTSLSLRLTYKISIWNERGARARGPFPNNKDPCRGESCVWLIDAWMGASEFFPRKRFVYFHFTLAQQNTLDGVARIRLGANYSPDFVTFNPNVVRGEMSDYDRFSIAQF